VTYLRFSRSGKDFSCEVETCRGGPSRGELVGDAANWPKTRRLASVGLDQGLCRAYTPGTHARKEEE
jgi:hypothetical protein